MVDNPQWNPPASALPIWPGTPPGFNPEYHKPVPTLTPYPVFGDGRVGAVIVLPGGGYINKTGYEAEPVARWLNSLGIAAFVLDYRAAPYRYPIPLLDARRGIQLVRSRANEWAVDPQRVGILGFSAGGHLASTTGTHFEQIQLPDGTPFEDSISRQDFRPDAMILCYPVITFGKYGHVGSMENLLGVDSSSELRESLSNQTKVSAKTPPTFLWHTATDEDVKVENSLMFAQALSACQVPFELHIFSNGEHGLGLATDHPSAGPWTGLCARWLDQLGFTKRV